MENNQTNTYMEETNSELVHTYNRFPVVLDHGEGVYLYDTEGKMEKTWAGTMQYEVDKDYYGLISKKDFLNDKKNYKKINTLF